MRRAIRMRLSGDPDDIAAVVAALRGWYDVAGGDRAYPNRSAFGVRVYPEARPRTAPIEPIEPTDREHRTR